MRVVVPSFRTPLALVSCATYRTAVLPKVSESQRALHFVENTSPSGLVVLLSVTVPVVMLSRHGLGSGNPLVYVQHSSNCA